MGYAHGKRCDLRRLGKREQQADEGAHKSAKEHLGHGRCDGLPAERTPPRREQIRNGNTGECTLGQQPLELIARENERQQRPRCSHDGEHVHQRPREDAMNVLGTQCTSSREAHDHEEQRTQQVKPIERHFTCLQTRM